MFKRILIVAAVLLICSCNQEKPVNTAATATYFDINGYFEGEISRLQKLRPSLNKTVSINGEKEQKKVVIENWQKELQVFQNADINKSSWGGEFKLTRNKDAEIYSTGNPKIPVKSLLVLKDSVGVQKIEIIISRKNILFQSNDTLTYLPNRIYDIRKQQKIRFLADKSYQITGEF